MKSNCKKLCRKRRKKERTQQLFYESSVSLVEKSFGKWLERGILMRLARVSNNSSEFLWRFKIASAEINVIITSMCSVQCAAPEYTYKLLSSAFFILYVVCVFAVSVCVLINVAMQFSYVKIIIGNGFFLLDFFGRKEHGRWIRWSQEHVRTLSWAFTRLLLGKMNSRLCILSRNVSHSEIHMHISCMVRKRF